MSDHADGVSPKSTDQPDQPDQVPVLPPPVAGSVFGEPVQYESDEARDHWNDDIWHG